MREAFGKDIPDRQTPQAKMFENAAIVVDDEDAEAVITALAAADPVDRVRDLDIANLDVVLVTDQDRCRIAASSDGAAVNERLGAISIAPDRDRASCPTRRGQPELSGKDVAGSEQNPVARGKTVRG